MVPNFTKPVSYTHLDVYKRQGLAHNTKTNETNLHSNTSFLNQSIINLRAIQNKPFSSAQLLRDLADLANFLDDGVGGEIVVLQLSLIHI